MRFHGKNVVLLCFFPQYLPVYAPSEEEKQNPSLFANNVRKVMAKYVPLRLFFNVTRVHRWSSILWFVPADRALEVPLTDLSFEDREIILSEGELRIFDFSSLLEFNHLVCRLGWVEGRLDQPVRLGRLGVSRDFGLSRLEKRWLLVVAGSITPEP